MMKYEHEARFKWIHTHRSLLLLPKEVVALREEVLRPMRLCPPRQLEMDDLVYNCLHSHQGTGPGFLQLAAKGEVPFVATDMHLAVAGSLLAEACMPVAYIQLGVDRHVHSAEDYIPPAADVVAGIDVVDTAAVVADAAVLRDCTAAVARRLKY